MPEATKAPPTADKLNDAIADILKIDLFHDIPELVAGENNEYFFDSITLRSAFETLHLHLKAEAVSAPPPPPMANFGRSSGLIRTSGFSEAG